MRKMPALLLSAIVSFALVGCGAELSDTAYAEPGQNVASVNVFYDALAPYGSWVDSGLYGWVWVPSPAAVGADFFPYASGGHWIDTDWGWYFASDFDWGWAPFHYGRWYFDVNWGWTWVPGVAWAPSWVDWRWGDGYVGWAPLPPIGRGRVVRDHRSHWVFARDRDLTNRDVGRHLVAANRARLAFRATRPMNDEINAGETRWHRGPPDRVFDHRIEHVRITPPRQGVVVRGRVHDGAIVHEPVVAPRARLRENPSPRYQHRPAPRPNIHVTPRAIRGPVRMPMHPVYRAAPRRRR